MTDHVLSFLSAYQGTLAEAFALPHALTQEYELFDCLRESSIKSTYLLRNKADDSFAVLKVAKGDAREHLHAEYEILNNLRSVEFPQALSYCYDQHADYFLRGYVAGTPVSGYIGRNGPFTEAEAVGLVRGLCDTLAILHAQTPPVIHRDIKPQNVIFTQQRTLTLIDFDAARRYQREQKEDTVCLGTQATAAPEQFGYQQTDQRSDIYSTGILLLYLCTGSYEPKECARVGSRALRRVIETCTRFDPARRYKNISGLSRSLDRVQRSFPSVASFWRGAALGLFAGIAVSAALALSGAVSLTQAKAMQDEVVLTQPTALPAVQQAIVFDSPEIENAVREQLGFDAETSLYQADLDRVRTLYLCGANTKTYWGDVLNYALYYSNSEIGLVSTLTDIPKLRNLGELALCNQNITDLTPLEGMSLTRLALNGNMISDLTPLSSLHLLQELYVGSNPVTQIDVVKNFALLHAIDLSSTSVYDLSPLSSDMTEVYLCETPVLDYAPLLEMQSLQTLFLSRPTQDCLLVLSQLSSLTSLEIRQGVTSLTPVLALPNLNRLALAPTQLTDLEGMETLAQLHYFRIIAAPDIDLTPLTKMPSLTELDIVNQELADYSAIFEIPNLKTLYCRSKQQSDIEALGQSHTFEIQLCN